MTGRRPGAAELVPARRESGPERQPPDVTVVIPTWNAGPSLAETLERIRSQNTSRRVEILAVDSGSTDGTVETLRDHGARVLEIPQGDFNHGLTRNLAVSQARGEIVVLTVQDALPYDDDWLQPLVDCFDDPEVAGAYSCQLPRPGANPFVRDRLRHWVAADPHRRIQSIGSFEAFERLAPLERLSRVAFDNVSSAVRRSLLDRIPFRERQFGEDLDWGLRAVLAGWKIVFEPASKVVHSHDRSIWYEFKRVYLDHQNLHRLLDVRTIPDLASLRVCARSEADRLRRVMAEDPLLEERTRRRWRVRAVLYAVTQNLAQYLGARSDLELLRRSPWFGTLDRLLRRAV